MKSVTLWIVALGMGCLEKLSHATAVPLRFMMLYLYPVLAYPGLPRQHKRFF